MLKKRLIPVLILRDGQVVQSIQFKHTNVLHWKPETAVDFFNKWAVDEIVLLDVSRTKDNRQKFYDAVEAISNKCFVPLAAGGWVDSIDEMHKLLRLGADKIVLNTKAVISEPHHQEQPEPEASLLVMGAMTFGKQCMVVSIDAKREGEQEKKVVHRVYVDRGQRIRIDWEAVDWARKAEELGAGEIFLTSIDNDGSRNGYDLDLIRSVTNAVSIPVIAFGGAFEWNHLAEGIRAGAEACAAANVFHFTEHSTKKAKEFLKKEGIDVR